MRVHGIEIPVHDMDRAYTFYRDVLRFPVIGRFGEDLSMFFLSDVHGGMAMLTRSEGPPDGGGPRLILTADGVDGVRAGLEAMGVTFLGGTDHSPLGSTAHFLDSEGNRLVLFDNAITQLLREQARASNAKLASTLDARKQTLLAALSGLSEHDATSRPAPDEWPILGHVAHVVDTLDSCGVIARDLAHVVDTLDSCGVIARDLAHVVDTLDSCGVIARDLADGREPPRDSLLRPEYALETLASGRRELERALIGAKGWLRELPDAVDGDARLVHGVFGGLSAREWAAFMLFHIGLHTDQIRAITSANR